MLANSMLTLAVEPIATGGAAPEKPQRVLAGAAGKEIFSVQLVFIIIIKINLLLYVFIFLFTCPRLAPGPASLRVLYIIFIILFHTKGKRIDNDIELTYDDNEPNNADPNLIHTIERFHSGHPNPNCRAYKILAFILMNN
jgi:hypothetical protein